MSYFDTQTIPSAWKGLERFAWWIVSTMDPKVICDLGVDEGFSTIELARYCKGEVFGVDHFQGDAHAGTKNSRDKFNEHVFRSGMQNIRLLDMTFDDASTRFERESIDILHIDGFHTYHAVKHDFYTWLPKVRKGGVILMHDTQSFAQDVGRFYHELDLPKFELTNSSGLGVVTKL